MTARLANSLLGIALMAAPAFIIMEPAAADALHILGPCIATFAIIAIWPATRSWRRVNSLFGTLLILLPLPLSLSAGTGLLFVVCGAAVFALSLLQGRTEQRFGGGWSTLWREPPKEAA